MEQSKILQASLLDITFDGRNKAYGAYELRYYYGQRLTRALIIVFVLTGLLGLGFYLSERFNNNRPVNLNATPPVVLEILPDIPDEVEPPPPPPPPPPAAEPPPQLATSQYVSPIVKPDDEVSADERPPEMSTLEDTKIGLQNLDGGKDIGIVGPSAPVADGGKGIGPVSQVKKDPDIFTSVQIEASYPGGMPKWQRFLTRNFRYPQQAADNEIQGIVMVQFVVDSTGGVSKVKALSGPPELYAEAIRVITSSGKWNPGIQNGRRVPSYKRQPIVFKLALE